MTDIASHIRIFEASPTDEYVEKRQSAIAVISENLKKRASFTEILGLADSLAAALAPRGKLPDELAAQVEAAIRNASPSFILDGHQLEAKVCATLGVVTYLESVGPGTGIASRSDVLALALWSALSFQKPVSEAKLEKLRSELLGIARDLATRAAENSRKRAAVTEVTFAPPETEGWAGIEKKWNAGPQKVLDALGLNAALDREEIDVLWWALADWSTTYQRKLSSIDARLRTIAASWELVTCH